MSKLAELVRAEFERLNKRIAELNGEIERWQEKFDTQSKEIEKLKNLVIGKGIIIDELQDKLKDDNE